MVDQPDPLTRHYVVSWAIDVDAANPRDAAQQALAAQRRRGSTATVFDVRWTDTLGDPAGTEVTSRVQVDLDQDPLDRQRRPPSARLPTVTIDIDRARRWLAEPAEHDPALTNAEYCGLTDDPPFSYRDEDFLARADDLITAASHALLFGDTVDLQLYPSSGGDTTPDGALLVVAIATPNPAAGALRLASYHLEHRDLAWDTATTAHDAALGVLRAAAATATDVLDRAQHAAFISPAQPATADRSAAEADGDACGGLRWLISAPDGDTPAPGSNAATTAPTTSSATTRPRTWPPANSAYASPTTEPNGPT